jgi:hypothetical protein
VTPTEVTFPERTDPVLDDSGTRIAAVTGGLVTVQSLPEGRTLAAARLPGKSQHARLLFTGDERLRIYAQDEQRLDVYELDLRARRLEHTGTREGMGYFNANADASRLLAMAGSKLLVLDGRTAAVLATLPGPGQGLFLSDGRVAVMDRAGAKLSIYGGDYVLQREVPMPALRRIELLREVEGGTLLVGGNRERIANEADGRGWNVYVVDLAKGAVVRTGRELRPLMQNPRDPRRTPADADMPFVFLDRRGAVVLWDAADGSRRAVTRASVSLPDALLAAALHLQSFDECENPPG